jgi:hypothetical protein
MESNGDSNDLANSSLGYHYYLHFSLTRRNERV